jgi:hypothetical protein
MPEKLVQFDEPITDPSGRRYFAQAVGHHREDGLWEGWVEFIAVNEDAPALGSARETTQPNRADIEYWAQGLSMVYLEGALARAESLPDARERVRAAESGKSELDYT